MFIGKTPDPRCQRHKGHQKRRLQGGLVPITVTSGLGNHGEGGEEDGVIGEGREELGAEQDVNGVVHADSSAAAYCCCTRAVTAL